MPKDIVNELLKNNINIDDTDNNGDDAFVYLKSNENSNELKEIYDILNNYKRN
ncbi:hypothetical protein [uncultured Brachyspira sp.]|uniref:hypothetical protein n=1 Tax=uncultured Brachyspira sp. TaxID=221953 RepID=UPI0025F9BF84|nr:hypothetical protein [uncultured Brachyspira sp.]